MSTKIPSCPEFDGPEVVDVLARRRWVEYTQLVDVYKAIAKAVKVADEEVSNSCVGTACSDRV